MKIILIFLGALFCNYALAEDYVWHTSHVAGLYVFSDGSFAINVKDDSEHCTPAAGIDQFIVRVDESGMREVGRKNILSTVLVALAQGAKLSISFDPGSPFCFVNRLQLRYI